MWQQIVRFVKRVINMTFIRHLMSTVQPAQKHENIIHVFTRQLFVIVLLKNIAQPIL